jgi:hypothetical protein
MNPPDLHAHIEQIASAPPTWRLRNPTLDVIVMATEGGLSLQSMQAAEGSVWQGLPPHPLLYLTFNAPQRGVAGPWHMQSWRVATEGNALRLDVEFKSAAESLTLVESLWLAGDLPVLRHWVQVRNDSAQAVHVDRYHLLDLTFVLDVNAEPWRAFYVDTFAGHRRDRWEPGDLNFETHEAVLEPLSPLRLWVGAYQTQCSWLALRRADGAGLVAGLEYDGAAEMRAFNLDQVAGASQWSTATPLTGGMRLTAAPIDALNVVVSPGESWASPVAFWGLFQGLWDHAAHLTHDVVEYYLAPPLPDEQFPYVVFNSWGYTFNLTRDALLRCLDVAAEIGVEMFDADYGWQRALGDWTPVDAHMPLLGDLSRMVHERGMKFGVWMAFANADPGTPLLAEHPDWVTYPDDWGSFRSRALCMGNVETRRWATEQAIHLIAAYGIDYLKHDFELITPCTHPRHSHPPDPAGYHSALGYQQVLRDLRRAHPHLLIENCQGGGRTMTYAMVQTHDASISSDGAVLGQALSRRKALYGMSYAFPLRYCANYMEERPTDYACHSSMIGGPWILMDRASEWTPTDIASAKRNIAMYKELRKLFRGGRVHHLRAPGGTQWDALQVQQPGGAGVALLFQPHGARGNGDMKLLLCGLAPQQTYVVSVNGQQVGRLTGQALMQQGLPRTLSPGHSEVIFWSPV